MDTNPQNICTNLKESRSRSMDTLAGSDYFVSEKGDINNRPKSAGLKNSEEKPQKEEHKVDSSELPSPFKIISERTPLIDLNGLLHITPEPFPHLSHVKTRQGQISVIADHVKMMKKDMSNLQQIAEQYKCMENYMADIDFLVEHIKDAITE